MELDIKSSKPVYTIEVASQIVGIGQRMLREYEKAGFIKPARINGKRRYSQNDIQFIKNIRFYLEEVGMTITALKVFYLATPCWEIKQCGQVKCPAYHNCRKKCWEAIKHNDNCDVRTCHGCPIYLVRQTNRNMKIFQGMEIGPKCFTE